MNEDTNPQLPPHEVKIKRGENLIDKLYEMLDKKDQMIADQQKRNPNMSLLEAFLFFLALIVLLGKLKGL